MNIDDLRVPRKKGLDKRIKLTDADRVKIIEAHENGASINGLARDFKVSKRLIQFILFPERHKKNLQDRQKRGGWEQYYEKEKNMESQRRHRRHKKRLLDEGQLYYYTDSRCTITQTDLCSAQYDDPCVEGLPQNK